MDVTVRIMNSHDWGHFEVTLTEKDVTVSEIAVLQAQAQVLVRNAIAEYKGVIKKERQLEQEEFDRQYQADIDSGKELPF